MPSPSDGAYHIKIDAGTTEKLYLPTPYPSKKSPPVKKKDNQIVKKIDCQKRNWLWCNKVFTEVINFKNIYLQEEKENAPNKLNLQAKS